MHESKAKERRRTFKKPANPFELVLVIDHEQWDRVQEYLEAEEHKVGVFMMANYCHSFHLLISLSDQITGAPKILHSMVRLNLFINTYVDRHSNCMQDKILGGSPKLKSQHQLAMHSTEVSDMI